MQDILFASSVADLLDFARAAERDFGEVAWFRGHACKAWTLVPSAHRRHPSLEAQFSQHFRLLAPSISDRCPPHADTTAWLPLMRHYGLPTRLLDWSESVLVATYFALDGMNHEPSVVWALAPGALNSQSLGRFIPFLVDERVKPLVSDAFGTRVGHTAPEYLAALAPRTDRRMAAQLGNYTIHGTREPLEQNASNEAYLRRITISSSAIPRIRSELHLAGVRTSILFPDLSSLAREIAELRALGREGQDLEDVVCPPKNDGGGTAR